MKTIKFILNDDGSIQSSSIGFQINQYSYNDTLINVYVPKELLDNMTNTETYVYGNNVTMAMYYTLANASQKLGTTYYFTPVKKADGTLRYYVDINHKQYAIFERKMPKEFTLYSGTQQYALNVISYRTDISVTPNTTEIIGIVSSATFNLDIQPSLNMATNPQEVDTDLSTLIANVNAILTALGDFQHKEDGLIHVAIANGSSTYTDYVVEALNYLNLRVNENYTINGTQTGDITSLDGRVTTLEEQAISGFRYIGSITSSATPNATDLNAYATTQGITLQNGDIAIWIQTISGGTDKTYRCIWDYPNNWTWYEIPPVELASNDSAGLIQGNYGNDTTSNILASIVGGKIVDIYFKQSNNTYASIRTTLLGMSSTINNILNGNTMVGKALYSVYDMTELGAITPKTIDEKFMTKTDGATKTFVQNYALPREFNDVYQLKFGVTGGFATDMYSNDDSEVPTLTNRSVALSLGDNTIITPVLHSNEYYKYQLSSKNSFTAIFDIAFTNNITDVGFTLNITYHDHTNNTDTLVASTTTDRFDFDTNTHTLTISDYFNRLDNVGIKVDGDWFVFELICNTSSSATNDLTIYSTTGTWSTFSFSTDAYTIATSNQGIIVHEKILTLDTSNNNVLVADLGNLALLDKTQHQFILHLPVGVSWTNIPENCYFEIIVGGVSIGYSINKKFYSDIYIGVLSQFLNNADAFNFIATCLDDGNGSFYFDIVSEDDISIYITRDEDITYDSNEDKYYASSEYVDMLLNKVCIVNFNNVGIVNNYPQNTLLRLKEYDNVNKIYSFDYALYDDNTQAITNYNIKLLYDTDNDKWYFACGKDGIYTQATINSLLNSKADLTNSSQVITADKVKVNDIRDLNNNVLFDKASKVKLDNAYGPAYVGEDTSTNILAKSSNTGIWRATDNNHWYYWNGTQYADGGVYQAIQLSQNDRATIDNAITIHPTYSFNNGTRVFTDFDNAPANERVYLASGITNYEHAPINLFGASNDSYVETYKIGTQNYVQYCWLARIDGSGVLCERSAYTDNNVLIWSDWTYNDYGNEPIIVSTATELYNKVIWLNNNNKHNAIVKLTPNTTFDFSSGINGSYNDIPLGNNITIIGSPNSVIYCNYQGSDTNVNQLYSIFKKWQNAGGYTLDGVVIRAYNIRYCVHDEAGNMPDNYHNKYINCDFYLNQNGKTDAQRDYYLQCIGGGLGRNGNILIVGCKFETVFDDFVPSVTHPDIPEVTYHNVGGNNGDNYKSHITIVGNYFKHTCAVSCYGYQTEKSIALISNNDVSVKPYLYWQSGDASENMELKEWNNHLHNAPDFTESDYTPYINVTYGTISSNSCYEMGKMLFLNFKILTSQSISAWTEIGSMQTAYNNDDYFLNGYDGSGNIIVLYLAPAGSIYLVTPVSANVTIQVSAQVRIK